MDPGTHVLASLALARGFFPRQPRTFVLAIVLAGTLADADLLTLLFGPGAYLAGRNTWTHSLIGLMLIVGVAGLVGRWLHRSGSSQKAAAASQGLASIWLATALAAVAHLLLDLATSSGIAIFWPLHATRYSWDLLPATDLCILALLLSGLLLPELFALVTSEIGAKEKAPRGRNAALFALALLCLYLGGRATLHGNAVAQLEARAYRGESPRRVAALPDSLSLLTWHGIVETVSLTCIIDVPGASAARFDPERAACVHKPEPSPVLTAAQQTDAMHRFLQAARFPRASVSATELGSEVVVRDLRAIAEGQSRYALAARVLLDAGGQVTSQRLAWARDVHLR